MSRLHSTIIALLLSAPTALASPLQDSFLDDELDQLLEGELISESGPEEASVLRNWKGFVELKPRVYLSDSDRGKNDGQLIFQSELELDFRFHEDVSAYFRPRLYLDALDGDLLRFEPLEAYVTYESDSWDLRAGQFVENWGVVDTYNPLDVINRRDFATDPLDFDRLGELGLRYRHVLEGGARIGEPTLSAYALPVFRETPFAPEDQRQSLETRTVPFDEDDGFEPTGAEQGLYAARYQSTLNTAAANADVQLLAARGPSHAPVAMLDPGGTLVPAYYGATTLGAGIRAVPNEDAAGDVLAALTFKAEVVYTAPYTFDDSPISTPDDYLAYVVGVDRAFNGVFSELDELTLTLEYAGETGAHDAAQLLRPFGNDLIVRGLFETNDFARQSIEVRGLFDLELDEQIYELIVERQLRSLNEDLKLIVQLQLFHTADPGESLYGSLDDLSSIAAGLHWDL